MNFLKFLSDEKERTVPRAAWLSFPIQTITFLCLVLLFVWPIFRLVALGFNSEHGVTFENYQTILSDPFAWRVVLNTLLISTCSMVIATVLGVSFAWLMAYVTIRGKKIMQLFIVLPFVIPSYITTLAWTQLFSENSLLAKLLSLFPGHLQPWNLYSYMGMIFILGITHYPLVYLFTVNVLRKIPREMEQACRVSGGSKALTFCRVTLPMALPGIVSGAFLAFLASLDNFGIPAFLGIPAHINVLSTYIYQQIIGFGPDAFARASVFSVLLGVLALLAMLGQWLLQRTFKAGATTSSERKPRYILSRHSRVVLELVIWLFFIATAMIPFVAMMMTSLLPAYGLDFTMQNMSLKNYAFVLFESPDTQLAIRNSLNLAVITTVIGAVIGTAFAYLQVRKSSRWLKLCESFISLPYALPGTVMALSMIFVWMEPIPGWNPGIYGSMTILFIAYFTRFLILQVRGSATAVLQVDRSMEEAAQVSGANGWTKWQKILIPLLIPGILSGASLLFLTALTELTVSALLYSAQSKTIGVVIFGYEQAGYTTFSTAFSSLIVLLILIGFAILSLVQTFWRRKEGIANVH
ncbi:iron ABC transporter permease [Sporolactobacillus shoreicorticis]|uniref:ABC transporter permease n=1 Tax=Sporolactobacillus shoreicorticis TaxID=1923877 RepID=A0ABW5S3I1_9BACL|nr:iron ABC transporter permease [Sporolactobacillus shoreicorticis]MCO7124419.1 iron ABC transporter permease [Sporolactobacillus shoreicorticis]